MATTFERPDPVRNFKFLVEATGADGITFGEMGFMTVDGLAMDTDMLPYREGGFNTTPHKLPGQTNFSPLTMSAGVYWEKPEMWNLARRMFSVQHGAGTLAFSAGRISQYRYTMVVRVLAHPVTKGAASGSQGVHNYDGVVMAFKFENCWTAAVGFGGLDAQNNGVLVHQMTVHHEGFETFYGHNDAINLRSSQDSAGTSVLQMV